MKLNFFGIETGLKDMHTSAYFETKDNKIVIIDCPFSAFYKMKRLDLKKYNEIIFLITHTHGDHIGCLGLAVQLAYFTLKIPVTIIAPSPEVEHKILILLNDIEGCELEWFNSINAKSKNMKKYDWFKNVILTEHSPQLKNRCFGYALNIDNTNIIYTGDTSTLEPFKPYLTENSEIYIDTSVHYGMIHLKLEDILDYLISIKDMNINAYLMHIDDIETAKEIINNIPNIHIPEIK